MIHKWPMGNNLLILIVTEAIIAEIAEEAQFKLRLTVETRSFDVLHVLILKPATFNVNHLTQDHHVITVF